MRHPRQVGGAQGERQRLGRPRLHLSVQRPLGQRHGRLRVHGLPEGKHNQKNNSKDSTKIDETIHK